nr:hypothetical protein Itr_chr02CG11430 [Ipomoea trifida]GLL25857.1 hypothetical protein Itr_chr04CG24870 [Ipomoea trifida]GLL33641.1 hypothetical protein Itr_chr08CG14190 [Ipomoea trifida]GLL41430.1 hypothetical protein Itr_chr12CG09560 [Ipomoea trifida]GLL47327.1 hypothetical protein Itr_chr14CG20730 [Ipomoea trifida]
MAPVASLPFSLADSRCTAVSPTAAAMPSARVVDRLQLLDGSAAKQHKHVCFYLFIFIFISIESCFKEGLETRSTHKSYLGWSTGTDHQVDH